MALDSYQQSHTQSNPTHNQGRKYNMIINTLLQNI